MSDKYFYRPIAAYNGKVFKCAGICDASNVDKANDLYIEKADPVYLPGFSVVDGYKGDKITIGRDNVAKAFDPAANLFNDILAESRAAVIAEAIENADAYLNNVAIPNYSELAASLVVKVEVVKVYGNDMIYPKNSAAERFAAISGKKTFSSQDLANIKALGFAVEEVASKKLAA